MALNRKQKKQIDTARKKLAELRQRRAGAKLQPDDPTEVSRLEEEIAALEARVKKIQSE